MRFQSHTRLDSPALLWALGSFCALNRIPFDPELLLKRFPPPYTFETLIQAARALGFKIRGKACTAQDISKQQLPCLAVMRAPATTSEAAGVTEQEKPADDPPAVSMVLISEATAERVVFFKVGTNAPEIITPSEFTTVF